MKRTLTAAALAAVMLTPLAEASSIRVDDGREVIQTGDSAAKLSRYLGRAVYVEGGYVCKKPSNTRCKSNKGGWGSVYQYNHKDLHYTVEVYDGVITRIEWSR